MPSEAEIRRWVRDEQVQIKQEEQSACLHRKSGTQRLDGSITCDQCEKTLAWEDRYG